LVYKLLLIIYEIIKKKVIKLPQKIEDINISDVEKKLGKLTFNMDKEKIHLAKWILLFLFILIIISMLIKVFIYDFGYATEVNNLKMSSSNIFNTIFHSVVPMSSMIIGYYFGSSKS